MFLKNLPLKLILSLALCWCVLTCWAVKASKPMVVQNLTFANYWIRPPTGPNTAAYLTISTHDHKPDRLIRVECADASVVELHNHIEENGVMKMRPVPFISIGERPVVMKPGGLHVMLMGLKESFMGKSTVPLTLYFERAGMVRLDFPVKRLE